MRQTIPTRSISADGHFMTVTLRWIRRPRLVTPSVPGELLVHGQNGLVKPGVLQYGPHLLCGVQPRLTVYIFGRTAGWFGCEQRTSRLKSCHRYQLT